MIKRLLLGLFIFISGCAHKKMITPETAQNSRIEIDYVLGHSRYKYVAIGKESEAEVSSSRDDKVLEKKQIPLAKYQDFATRLEKAIKSSPKGVLDENCRTPYKVQIIIEERQSTIEGCRSADSEGQMGQLLQEGEFLFYSSPK